MDTLSNTALFRGLTEEELAAALTVLQAKERSYEKGTTILHAGGTTERMGLVLTGSVTVESNDLWGNRTLLAHVGPGQYFAETYALLREETMLVDAVANEDCRVLFLRPAALATLPAVDYPWLPRLLSNLLCISAHKNLALSGRSFHIAPKSARSRIMAYLNTVALQTHSKTFDIPFDRQQMADYLNLERTALSKELGRMRQEGILDFRKNHFILPE
ncbi:MAG: Crp/Fnr family transcriptional regulator [Oscillospiraceae bacterium]|nr:Crp/Fnr family transcriptional regulator [Oscillospiraceae bacterium]